MRTYLILFIAISFSLPVFAQQVGIEATVKGMPAGRVYLSQIRGDEQSDIDSLLVSGDIFRFILTDPGPGVYRIKLVNPPRARFNNEDPRFFDIIISAEQQIKVVTDFYAPMENMNVVVSEANRLFYDYLGLAGDYKNKGSALLPLFSMYSVEDVFFESLKAEFARFQKEYNEALISLSSSMPGSFAASYINLNLVPQVDPSQGMKIMNSFLRKHYLDLVSFNDPRLINSQAYTQKILEYLALFSNQSLTQSEQEDLFIEAVDAIMERASYNEEVFEFILGFLVDGFDQFKMEKVLVHLAVNYVEKGCETDSKRIMEQRLGDFKRMAIGNKVSDIVLLDINGMTQRLFDLNNEYILIVFWSSSCPHCTRLLPEIKEWYLNDRNLDLEVFSVSIDTSRFDWESHILMNNYPWTDVCNLQGWEGKAPSDYNVYATPTMFIIDKDRKIIAKPLTYREFRREIGKLVVSAP